MKIPVTGPDDEFKASKSSENESGVEAEQEEASAPVSPQDFPAGDIAELSRLLKEKSEEAENSYVQIQRTQADFENYKKRVEREKSQFVKYANEQLILELLKVLDDLERAGSLDDESSGIRLSEGMQLIENKFRNILYKAGLEEVHTIGNEFDPNYHEAVMITPARDGQDNIITQEIQKGYILSDKVIRPAKVVVAIAEKNGT